MAVETQRRAITIPTASPSTPIPALAALIAALGRERVSYCSWKSNDHLEAALAGETDVDLLVERAHMAVFRDLAARHGAKALRSPPGAAHPATEHFLGFDPSTGRLFHLHVQYQLVLGQRYVKNYRLPMERALLSSTRRMHGIAVPSAELELSILATRALLKYRVRDVVKDVLRIRTPGIPAALHAEVAWLLQQTTLPRIRVSLHESGSVVPSEIVSSFLHAMEQTPRSGRAFWMLRRRMRRALRPYRRHGDVQAWSRYLAASWRQRQRAVRRHRDMRMVPVSGGVTVGIVGADGAGKSTVAEATANWLGWKLQTRLGYLGSKPPSSASRALYLAFRAFRRSERAAARNTGFAARGARTLAEARDVSLALHYLSVGRDRVRRHRRALRDAGEGCVVIFDRFPLSTLSDDAEHLLLDGPQIATMCRTRSRATRALGVAEEHLYRRFRLPDSLVVLHVDPETAIARKPDHDRDLVSTKTRAVAALAGIAAHCTETRVSSIDANRSLDNVLADVKTEVWHAV